MKSGLMKRVFAIGMAAMLLAGDVTPVMAQSVSGNSIESGSNEAGSTEETANNENTNANGESTNVENTNSENTNSENTNSENTNSENTENENTENENTNNNENDETEENEETVSENEIDETEQTVSENDIAMVSLESVTVSGITITVSGPEDAFAEGTTVSAVEVEPAEVVIEAAEENEEAIVKRYKAFDINLVLDGENVQPLNGNEITVSFEGDMLITEEDTKEEVVVYHVDDNDNITKMESESAVAENENTSAVEMTTTHFSTYVVLVTDVVGQRTVTFEHYLVKDVNDKNGKAFYAPQTVTLNENEEMLYEDLPVQGGKNYTLLKVEVYDEKGKLVGKPYINDPNDTSRVTLDLNKPENTVKLYYKEGSYTFTNEVTFYDYYVDNYEKGNYYNYNAGINKQGAKIENKGNAFLAMGTSSSNSQETANKETNITKVGTDIHGYKDNYISKNGTPLSINVNNSDGAGVKGGDKAIVPGIVTGMTDSDGDGYYDVVNYGKTNDGRQIVDGGYFTNTQDGDYKYVYTNYGLSFKQTGNTYELDYVYNLTDNTDITKSKENGEYSKRFLPLSKAPKQGNRSKYQPYTYAIGGADLNYYFGMRYDFTFKIGDYIGDMYYEFFGDDDLWVMVDGKCVLDLGGMHSAYPGIYSEQPESNKVDIWEEVYGIKASDRKGNWWEKLTDAQKEEEHTVTVLYMERGGWDSSCGMKFVIPNVTEVIPNITTVPRADVTLTKMEEGTENVIENVQFTLYQDAACTTSLDVASTDEEGLVSFTNLREGTYYIKETGYDQNAYLPNDTIYKVVVAKVTSGDTVSAKATVYNGIDTNEELEDNIVYNTPKPQKGNLKIIKTVDKVDSVHGEANFTFKITCPDGSVLYRVITFDKKGTKAVEITDLPLGEYKVEELDTIRYELVNGYSKSLVKEVESEKTTDYEFSNTKVYERYYSHADTAVNEVTFNRDEEGNITSSTITTKKSSTGVYEVKSGNTAAN